MHLYMGTGTYTYNYNYNSCTDGVMTESTIVYIAVMLECIKYKHILDKKNQTYIIILA